VGQTSSAIAAATRQQNIDRKNVKNEQEYEDEDEEDEDDEEEEDVRGRIDKGRPTPSTNSSNRGTSSRVTGSMSGGNGGGGGIKQTQTQQQQQQRQSQSQKQTSGGTTVKNTTTTTTTTTAANGPVRTDLSPGLTGVPPVGVAYNPAEFSSLKINDEMRELFSYIGRYTPHAMELETRLRPFIPEYIPAISDADPFLKPPRPDGLPESLGLRILDEPSATQSDPTVLDLQLRSLSKKSGLLDPISVRSLENADKNPKEITKWIQNISDLHRSKPPPSVHYAKTMPDIEQLMQEWPAGIEDLLNGVGGGLGGGDDDRVIDGTDGINRRVDGSSSSSGVGLELPGPDISLSLEEYVRMMCAVLDIPVYGSLVQSLHVAFTLFHEFRQNVHFQANFGGMSNADGREGSGSGSGSGANGANASGRNISSSKYSSINTQLLDSYEGESKNY
jgi:intraflagellar transport protein 46